MTRRTLLAGSLMLSAAALFLGTQPSAAREAATTAPLASTRPTTQHLISETATDPAPRSSAWVKRHDRLVEKAKQGDIDLYMLGDSITDFWEGKLKFNWQENLGGWKPGDFGISGDRTEHVLWRIENGELDGVKPKAIVLLIGTNNLPPAKDMTPNTPEETAAGVKAILNVLHDKQPQAKVLLLAVFPRADKPVPLMDKIDKVNQIISTYADGTQVKFININDKLLGDDGKLTRAIMPDLLHPSDKGYQIWADAIRPTLTEWLGEPASTQP